MVDTINLRITVQAIFLIFIIGPYQYYHEHRSFLVCADFQSWLKNIVESEQNNTVTNVKRVDPFFQNHSFLFISGWPQSGTSLVHQMIDFSPFVSTMVRKCEEIIGKSCENFNHEGQWLLGGSYRYILNSGATCPMDASLSSAQREVIVSEVIYITT